MVVHNVVPDLAQEAHTQVGGGLEVLLIHHDRAAEAVGPPVLFVFDPRSLMLSEPHFQSRQQDVVVVGVLDEHRVAPGSRKPRQAEGGGFVGAAPPRAHVLTTVTTSASRSTTS